MVPMITTVECVSSENQKKQFKTIKTLMVLHPFHHTVEKRIIVDEFDCSDEEFACNQNRHSLLHKRGRNNLFFFRKSNNTYKLFKYDF